MVTDNNVLPVLWSSSDLAAVIWFKAFGWILGEWPDVHCPCKASDASCLQLPQCATND
jgi:hypothetical protein